VSFSKVPAVRSKAPKRAFANAGKPVHGAVVRFGAFSTVTDAKGRWTLPGVSPTAGTLVVSRDPVGAVDRTEVGIDDATLARAGTIQVVTPPMPLWPAEPVIRRGGLTRFAARIAPAKARTKGQTVTMTLGRRYRANGDEVVYRGGVSPSVDARYPTGRRAARNTKALRNWSRHRYLEFTATILRRPPADQAFHLIVTPGGSFRNATKVAVGNRTQLVRLPLRGLRGLKRVNYLRFGIQSGVPKPWRGGHDLKVTLRISNIQLVR
jgi:hypothetical protein